MLLLIPVLLFATFVPQYGLPLLVSIGFFCLSLHLLLNHYSGNVVNTIWKLKKVQERLKARLIRYADDFVVLCQSNTERVLRGIKIVLGDLELSLNEGKTFSLIQPSKKALKHIKSEWGTQGVRLRASRLLTAWRFVTKSRVAGTQHWCSSMVGLAIGHTGVPR